MRQIYTETDPESAVTGDEISNGGDRTSVMRNGAQQYRGGVIVYSDDKRS